MLDDDVKFKLSILVLTADGPVDGTVNPSVVGLMLALLDDELFAMTIGSIELSLLLS